MMPQAPTTHPEAGTHVSEPPPALPAPQGLASGRVVRPAHALKLVRRGCLVVPLGGDRPLARACVALLVSELPALHPTLDARPGTVEVVWACGYRAGAEEELVRLRAAHPLARIVVSGRDLGPAAGRLVAAGVDAVVQWPASIGELCSALAPSRMRA
jgi:hypothetical protein